MSGTAGRLSIPTALTSALTSTSDSPVASSEADVPGAARLVERGRAHFRAEPHVRQDVVLLRAARDVVEELVLARVVVRPVGVGPERVRVEVVGHVDPQVGVGVLEPRAADVGVLVEHRVRDPGLLEADRRAQAAEAGADDAHAEARERARRRGARPTRSADGRRRRSRPPPPPAGRTRRRPPRRHELDQPVHLRGVGSTLGCVVRQVR